MKANKTSAEQTREEQTEAQLGNMLDAAFGDVGGLQMPPEESPGEIQEPPMEDAHEALEEEEELANLDQNSDIQEGVDEPEQPSKPPTGPPSGPPSGPPTSPPSSPPTGPPSNPPAGAPSSPPSGPPSSPAGDGPISSRPGPPSGPPSSPPTGPPPSRPPSSPPSEPPSRPPTDAPSSPPAEPPAVEELEEEHSLEGEPQQGETEELIVTSTEEITVLTTGDDDAVEESEVVEENTLEEPMKEALEEMQNEQLPPQAETQHVTEESPELTEQQYLAEQEIARLNAEVERLRQSMAGAADVIEELETPPMPPAVMEDIVIAAHIVSDFARLARQLDREQLIRATMGTIAMLHPDNLGVLISTRNMTMLPRLDERGLCAGHLGRAPPRGAPLDWRILEVVLASVSLVTGGPAAVIHSHGAYTTAASCEKDLVLVQPIDEIGKKHIGKVIIVDPDHDNPEDFLRQIAEALNQGGMRCVVIRGMGAYAVGADMDQAWANAAMLEHSMRIVLLARQANLKI